MSFKKEGWNQGMCFNMDMEHADVFCLLMVRSKRIQTLPALMISFNDLKEKCVLEGRPAACSSTSFEWGPE